MPQNVICSAFLPSAHSNRSMQQDRQQQQLHNHNRHTCTVVLSSFPILNSTFRPRIVTVNRLKAKGYWIHCKDFTRHCGGFIPVGQLTPVTWYPGLQARSNNRYFKEKNILQVKPVEMAVITCKLFYPASAKSLWSLQGNITPMAVKTCNIVDQKTTKKLTLLWSLIHTH